MATRRYKANPGTTASQVVEEVGAATNSHFVELTVDLAATASGKLSGQRTISKNEVLVALEKIKEKIMKDKWPPA